MITIVVPAGANARLDRFLAAAMPDVSRAAWQRAIANGQVQVDGRAAKPSTALAGGETVVCTLPEPALRTTVAEAIELDVVFEDEWLLVINKPRGMVVHPAPGHPGGTVVNALLARYPRGLSSLGGADRPGIVHRIDKDTSGLLLAVKNDQVHAKMSRQLKKHAVVRAYHALVYGRPDVREGSIDAPIGRDPKNRQKMAVVAGGKAAVTHFSVLESLSKGSHLRLILETGRTHQIRVHLAYIGLPVVGDPLYARGRPAFGMVGQALHAGRLTFVHPVTGEVVDVTCPLPADFRACLAEMNQ
ncbi:MAG TPA: RluA family pseudouridine synthase [Clostridiaceae bacterium]|nr:RluA family pseudouridine synthase [Clostridiaceae bacterium]